jgi:hypothetical protein
VIHRPLVVFGGLTLAGVLGAAAILLIIGSDDGDTDAVASLESLSPTAESTMEPAESSFLVLFEPLACQLEDFTSKYNAWLAGAEERSDRIEVLGGIGFWREILAGIAPLIDTLPESAEDVRLAASEYVGALDRYLATLGEYWFTAQPPAAEAAATHLLYADQQRALLLATAEEAAGGPLAVSCPAAAT